MRFKITFSIAMLVLAGSILRAQESKLNTNLGAGVNVPLNPTNTDRSV